jgi:deoxyadenosine/deoxycytidine kinase
MENSTIIKPVFVIIRGLPGSGKSYIATEIANQIGRAAIEVLDPDATDYSSDEYNSFSQDLSLQGVDNKLHPYRYLRAKAYEAIISDKVIVWNQAFTNLDLLDRTIKNLQAFASEHGRELPALVVEVEIDHATAKARVASRAQQGGHGVSDEAFARFIDDYTSFSSYGYKTVKIDGDLDVYANTKQIVAAIDALRKT